MKDFLGKEIQINDEVIYIKLCRTGSSSSRKIMFKGKVVGFKGQKVEIECLYTNEWKIKEKYIDVVFSKDIVVLNEKKVM